VTSLGKEPDCAPARVVPFERPGWFDFTLPADARSVTIFNVRADDDF
jgi:hypothetical protein